MARNKPQYAPLASKSTDTKPLSGKQINKIESEVKALLHASRDSMRTHKEDTLARSFSCHQSYYTEAFGVMRGLHLLGYGYFGDLSPRSGVSNLNWWFHMIEKEVLEEEGFYSDHKCEYCFSKYGKDDSRRK